MRLIDATKMYNDVYVKDMDRSNKLATLKEIAAQPTAYSLNKIMLDLLRLETVAIKRESYVNLEEVIRVINGGIEE